MKFIGIIGTRRRNTYEDFKLVDAAFKAIYKEGDVIVSGGALKGGDTFAYKIHKRDVVPFLEFPANWYKYKNAAGPIRNTEIARWSDVLIACVSEERDGGTEDTIKKFLAKEGLTEQDAIEAGDLILV